MDLVFGLNRIGLGRNRMNSDLNACGWCRFCFGMRGRVIVTICLVDSGRHDELPPNNGPWASRASTTGLKK